jgi:hypothetical protein
VLRKTTCLLMSFLLVAVATVEARPKLEINVFSGLRFGGSFHDGGYQEDYFLLENLDVAPGAQFGASIGVPIGVQTYEGGGLMFELLFNFQGSDLRFEPESNAVLPDTILGRFEVDGDKIILGALDVMYIHGGVIYKFGSGSGWNPHVNLGLGATIFDAPEGDLQETKFSLSMGGGVTRMFNETFGARFQSRIFFTSLPAEEYWVDYYGHVWETGASNSFFQGDLSVGLVVAF